MLDFSKVLLTVDYDRTLTGPNAVVPQRNIDAITWFMENGGTFTVNTGRSINTFGVHMKTVPTNAPLLLFNGSAAYYQGEYVYTHPINLDMWTVLDQVAEEFPELNLEVQGLYDHYLINEKPEYVAFYDAIGWHHTSAKSGDDLGPFIKFALFGKPYKNAVATMFACSDEELAMFNRAEARILELWGDQVVTFRAAPRIIDVHAKGVSKLIAARDLQAQLGKKILVCVGDAENDITMLDGADYAFCPADGVVADRYETVCNCADGAVADVIYEKIPEILRKHP
ncbi:MAG: HAD family phosphatase [Oscillospiraceae bacterium]|nr:HAD family phosphatase [Oscillospiraceae bacterium]